MRFTQRDFFNRSSFVLLCCTLICALTNEGLAGEVESALDETLTEDSYVDFVDDKIKVSVYTPEEGYVGSVTFSVQESKGDVRVDLLASHDDFLMQLTRSKGEGGGIQAFLGSGNDFKELFSVGLQELEACGKRKAEALDIAEQKIAAARPYLKTIIDVLKDDHVLHQIEELIGELNVSKKEERSTFERVAAFIESLSFVRSAYADHIEICTKCGVVYFTKDGHPKRKKKKPPKKNKWRIFKCWLSCALCLDSAGAAWWSCTKCFHCVRRGDLDDEYQVGVEQSQNLN